MHSGSTSHHHHYHHHHHHHHRQHHHHHRFWSFGLRLLGIQAAIRLSRPRTIVRITNAGKRGSQGQAERWEQVSCYNVRPKTQAKNGRGFESRCVFFVLFFFSCFFFSSSDSAPIALSHVVHSAPVYNRMHQHLCARSKSQTLEAIPLSGHTKLIETGSTALAAVVAYPGKVPQISRKGQKYQYNYSRF